MNIIEFIGQIAVPVLALIVSGISFYLTNRMNKKVNKKDYEISENLKYEIMKLIAALRSMDAKAVLAPHFKQAMDYKQEIDILSKLQTSPGYLLFLHSVASDDDRMMLDLTMKMLVINGNAMNRQDIRISANRILDFIKNKTNFRDTLDVDVIALLDDLCDMRGTAPEFDESTVKQDNVKLKDFFEYLIKNGNTDPDVLLFYSIFVNDKELTEKAINLGASLNVTDKELIERYKKEYNAFCQKQ